MISLADNKVQRRITVMSNDISESVNRETKNILFCFIKRSFREQLSRTKGTSSEPVMKSIAALLVLFCFIAAVSCQAGGIQCSPPKCDAPCYLNYKTKPCPSLQCSPPKCDAPCTLNYSTKPCPSCDCRAVNYAG
ncbi:hypothetical protein TNIN_227061 [Trichonephila inaurata madagascariensis]|uniref:Uncharacterized protein n=1 Tax=Trichonephila inaurata madagascariensis TaxID=2747483 RepID=A0A8X6WKY2_9ARAC|nr:hypothetical protein TNIN_227061 [Trichonephila inaurata madagascariensis]